MMHASLSSAQGTRQHLRHLKESLMSKLLIPRLAPRNPLVAASRKRLAGAHGKATHPNRAARAQALRVALKSLHPPP